MAITKIKCRNSGLKEAIEYILNENKTDGRILTARNNCDPGREYRQMMDTKEYHAKTGGRQCYHAILSYKPGEITPELALQIAKEFTEEHLRDYEVVIAVHTDRKHIHSHLVWNSVNCVTGEKYHVSNGDYYRKIRAVSDRLCRKYGLSVIVQGDEPSKAVSYAEWLRQSRGQPTFRSMLEADIRSAIEDANSLGEFYMIMEHLGYEIKHGNRLSFRLRGQERFMCPGRKNPLFTEDNILAAIQNNPDDIEAGLKPAVAYRPAYVPYRKHPKYTGFLALYVHYLYILGKIEKREYPPRMTPRMRKAVMKFEQLREEFKFLRENDISTAENMTAYKAKAEEMLTGLIKKRTILNVRKRKRQKLYTALADVETLADVPRLSAEGVPCLEGETRRYSEAISVLEKSGIDRETLKREKAELYSQLAELNRKIRTIRKNLKMCVEISERTPKIERDIQNAEPIRKKRQSQVR